MTRATLLALVFAALALTARAETPPAAPPPWDVWTFDSRVPKPAEAEDWKPFTPENLPELTITLAQQKGQEAVAVGEASGMRWLFQSHDGGQHWSRPLFVPSFPPGALHGEEEGRTPCSSGWGGETWPEWKIISSSARGLIHEDVLSFRVAEACPGQAATADATASVRMEVLRRDTDADGLTDLFERWMRLDPNSADTDKDGIRDDVDPLPQVPVSQQGGVPASLLWDWLLKQKGSLTLPLPKADEVAKERVASDGGLRTHCLRGDPALLQGPASTRLIVISEGGWSNGYFVFWQAKGEPLAQGKQLGWRAGPYAGGSATVTRSETGWTIKGGREWQQ